MLKTSPACDVAFFCLTAIAQVLSAMTEKAREVYPAVPVLYAGGVMSDIYIQNCLKNNSAAFAEPAFSCDNAAGTAIYAALCHADCD